MFLNFEQLPNELPLFPLTGALLLPKSRLPLNIFEPKYLEMLDDALKTKERLIGMIQPLGEAPKGVSHKRKLHHIGCAGKVISFNETKDGRYLITLEGIIRFRFLEEVNKNKPYIIGKVEFSNFKKDLEKNKPDENFNREKFLKLLSKYFDSAQLSSDWESLKEADEELLINSLSMLCPFDPDEKQALLEAPELRYRRETLITLMEINLQDSHETDLPQ